MDILATATPYCTCKYAVSHKDSSPPRKSWPASDAEEYGSGKAAGSLPSPQRAGARELKLKSLPLKLSR